VGIQGRTDLHADHTREKTDGLSAKDLANRFLTAKQRKVDAGEMGVRSLADYKGVTDILVVALGANSADGLTAGDSRNSAPGWRNSGGR
jgi:hypothetical protein